MGTPVFVIYSVSNHEKKSFWERISVRACPQLSKILYRNHAHPVGYMYGDVTCTSDLKTQIKWVKVVLTFQVLSALYPVDLGCMFV